MVHDFQVGEIVQIGNNADLYSGFEQDYHGALAKIETIRSDGDLIVRTEDGESLILHPHEAFYPMNRRRFTPLS